MKIYFAGSIRGGRDDIDLYLEIIKYLRKYGEVLTEHVGDKEYKFLGEDSVKDAYIHNRDLKWLLASDVVVAEVSTPSLGVGYEIGRAVENNEQPHRKRGGINATLAVFAVVHPAFILRRSSLGDTRANSPALFGQVSPLNYELWSVFH